MRAYPTIFFVGIHNKPGMAPLDSRTKSGQVIDAVIAELERKGISSSCVKTNLCDVDYMPGADTVKGHFDTWIKRNDPRQGEIVVLLGRFVHENFLEVPLKVVRMAHPASMFGNADRVKYVRSAIYKIKKAIK